MHIYFTFLTFILGLVLASFFNALMYRIDNGYKYPDIFIKGSHCEKCGKYLSAYELIPILSYVIYKGKCSKCGYKVPMYYPLSELFLGLGLASIYFFSLPWILYIVLIFFFCFSYFDRIYKGIPEILVNMYLIVLTIYFFVQLILQGSIPQNSVIIGLILSIFIFVLGKVTKKPFGLGDILVLVGLSLVLDLKLYIGYIYVFLIVSSLSAVFLVSLKKATFKSAIPLLPYMFVSLVILFIFNIQIQNILERIFLFK